MYLLYRASLKLFEVRRTSYSRVRLDFLYSIPSLSPPFFQRMCPVLHCLHGSFNRTWIDHLASGLHIPTLTYSDFWFPYGSRRRLKRLTLLACTTSPDRSYKSNAVPHVKAVPQLVNTVGVQVLSLLPGPFFTLSSLHSTMLYRSL